MSSSNGSESSGIGSMQVAPFVWKTYGMVSDSRTDGLIRWGRENNSFLVLDPSDFALHLLPSYFKHANFSSFVRQLNTYGFRKIDPDRWEFAHESFLRGQTHLLPLVIRRKRKINDEDNNNCKPYIKEEQDNSNEILVQEVGHLRRQQKALEEELQGLNKRLQITERRPHQMISFLVRIAEDPDLLPRLILSKKKQQKQQEWDQEINKRLHLSEYTARSLPLLPQPFQIEDNSKSSDEISQSTNNFVCDNYCNNIVDQGGSESQVFSLPEYGGSETNTVAYPFSLLGHVFF